jgi:hypothetical protein
MIIFLICHSSFLRYTPFAQGEKAGTNLSIGVQAFCCLWCVPCLASFLLDSRWWCFECWNGGACEFNLKQGAAEREACRGKKKDKLRKKHAGSGTSPHINASANVQQKESEGLC